MSLVMREFDVRGVTLGTSTCMADRVLSIHADSLEDGLRKKEKRIQRASLKIARPGEATRIVCTKDVIQPRFKLNGSELGSGTSQVLKNVAVVTCGPIVAFQEGIIDMSGPGARYTPFSELTLIVLEVEVVDGTDAHQHEEAVRVAGLHAADLLASTCSELSPDRILQFPWIEKKVDASLPRIAYIDMVLSQGLLHDTYVRQAADMLGRNAKEGLPRSVDPRVIIDGGLVSGNCVSACDKTTTFHHQNNPVIMQLLGGHGNRWDFAGTVITNEPTRLAAKQRSAQQTVDLLREMNVDGAIITKEGFGNPDADLMMIISSLEAVGIKTVAVTDEYAGRNGDSQSLADTTPEADALVSVGNANQQILLPPMQSVIGPLPDVNRLAGGYAHSVREDGSMLVELQAIVGATNQLGFGLLSCLEH